VEEKSSEFKQQVQNNITTLGSDIVLKQKSIEWMLSASCGNYTYNFSFMGRPIIQYPQDMIAMQELIWSVKPDLIIETGIAHGGSLIMNAALLAMIDYCEAVEKGELLDTSKPDRYVLGIDIDIRPHNRAALLAHPMSNRIYMIEGSSIDPTVVAKVTNIAKKHNRVLVCLDSNHTHNHVLEELLAYSPLVTKDSYCVVFDTVIEDTPEDFIGDRPWGKGNNPKTAVWEFLKGNDRFEIDKSIENKLLITVAPDGYLKCIKD
jgi:cephalosporin hydroxylase